MKHLIRFALCLTFLSVLAAQIQETSSAQAPNSPPVAAGDSYTIHGSATIGSVLANDFDPDGDPMSPDVLTFPAHGNISAGQPGFYFYNLTDLSFTGTDTFTYRACDTHQARSGAVTVNITVVNQAPVG